MFDGCTSLTQAPALPSTEVDYHCYEYMFSGCTSLTEAPALPATILSGNCYSHMFDGCTSLTQAPELPATGMAYGCYRGMFSGCTSLTEAPEILVEGAEDSYTEMFIGCTSLSKIKVNFTRWDSYMGDNISDCDCMMFAGSMESWVYNVAPTGTFICPDELNIEYGVSRIPEGWEVVQFNKSGTENVTASSCSVWTEDHSIFVRGAVGRIEVYDLNGKLLRSAQGTENETVRFVLPGKGTYVVKTETKSVKIMN